MRAVEIAVHLAVLDEGVFFDFLLKLLLAHEEVVLPMHFPGTGIARRVADAELEEAGVLLEEPRNEGTLRDRGK